MILTKDSNSIQKEFPHQSEYALIRPVGTGGFGCVWEAEHRILKRKVALKFLTALPGDLDKEQFVYEEGRGMAGLNTAKHPGAAHIVHLNRLIPAKPPFPPVLEMEWLDGGDLAQYVESRGPLSEEELLRMVSQIGAALDCAHQNNYVHGDVKPKNILITGKHPRTFKLGDFGISRRLGEHLTLSSGTPGYMAPEQIGSAPKGPSQSADIHSFAKVICFATSGQFPEATQSEETVKAYVAKLPDSLRKIVSAALLENPQKRPTASEFTQGHFSTNNVFAKAGSPPSVVSEREGLTVIAKGRGEHAVKHWASSLCFERSEILANLWLPDRLPNFTDYLTFITDSGYAQWHPLCVTDAEHDGGYLGSWIDGGLPPRLKEYPMGEIPHAAARDFCQWLGARLPSVYEIKQLLPKVHETALINSLEKAVESYGYPLEFWSDYQETKSTAVIGRLFAGSAIADRLIQTKLPSTFCLSHLLCLPVISDAEARRLLDRTEISKSSESTLNDGQTIIG